MKAKTKLLDVDVIGGLSPLTKEEEFSISEYLRNKKNKPESKITRKPRIARKKFVAG